MAIVFCGLCQKKLNAPDSFAGKKAKCPGCGSSVQIPVNIGVTSQTVMPDDTEIKIESTSKTIADALFDKKTVYTRNNLVPGERILGVAQISMISLLVGIAIALVVFLGLAAFIAMALVSDAPRGTNTDGTFLFAFIFLSIIFLLPVALFSFLRYKDIKTREVIFTDKRFLMKIGWLSVRTVEITLDKIESVSIQQGVVAKYLGYGSIIVNGTGQQTIDAHYIENPLGFRRKLLEAQNLYKRV